MLKLKLIGVLAALNLVIMAQAQNVIAGPTTNPANGHAYYLLAASTWTASEAKAITLGGHLATIRNLEENNWIYAQFSQFGGTGRALWIGLNDVATEGTFVWASGESVRYTRWWPGEPNNFENEDYVHLLWPAHGGHSFWNDDGDSGFSGASYHGVVEVDPVVQPSSFFVSSGFQVSGDLASLFNSDDNCLGLFPNEDSLIAQVEINATSPIQTPSAMTFVYEGSVSRFGLIQIIGLRNYSAAFWTTIAGIAPTADTTIEFTLTTSAADHVGPSGALKAQVTWQPINDEDPAQDGWLHCIDLAIWRVTG